MRIVMDTFVVAMLLTSVAPAAAAGTDTFLKNVHRYLKGGKADAAAANPGTSGSDTESCVGKGESCGVDIICCGSETATPRLDCVDGRCCLTDGTKGCETNDDCCSTTCDDASCVPWDGGLPCGIKEMVCDNDNEGGNSCCGDNRYSCMELDLLDDDMNPEETYCCLNYLQHGCGRDLHCCPGTVCQSLTSTCVYDRDEFVDDSRSCGLKGDDCSDDGYGSCCGETKYDCNESKICCIKLGQNGCEDHSHCCNNHCFDSLCCIELGENGCEADSECCSDRCVASLCCNEVGGVCDSDDDCCTPGCSNGLCTGE